MEIIQKNPEDLEPYGNNSRIHNVEHIKQIICSINEFGFTNPLLINPDNGVVAGHGRLAAAISMGLSKVPCIILEGLTEAQERAYVIADNKIALNSSWDFDMLKIELSELESIDFDVSLIGFDEDDLAEIWSENGEILDYSILENTGLDEALEQMNKGIRKAIQIEFKPEDFEEAKLLCSKARSENVYIGEALIKTLKNYES